MAWSEFDVLSDVELLAAASDLRSALLGYQLIQTERDEDGNLRGLNLAENYEALDLSDRLQLLLGEVTRRGLSLPELKED